MLNSELCDIQARSAAADIFRASAGTGLEALKEADLKDGQLKDVARDFASLFYTFLVRKMMKSVPMEEDAGPMARGARDIFSLHLPQALAESDNDPITNYIERSLTERLKGTSHE